MPTPVDPINNLKYALEGRIVTMDENALVLSRGRIFVSGGEIVAVTDDEASLPGGFTNEDIIAVGGTIYPGMIELHNHLPYNILPPWVPNRTYGNHRQWKGRKEYRQYITGPMQTLGKTDGFPGAIVRYTECKSLVGGVTTSQGWTLANSRIRKRFYHGVIRNVEETNDPKLPEAQTRIADVSDPAAFRDSLRPDRTRLLHLSEGVDEKARSFFLGLHIEGDEWAITDRLAGIHCTGLEPEDFRIFADRGGSMIWSPMSNLVLYGETADIAAAKENNVLISLGADWSPSGGKNLLEELKVARLVSDHAGGVFTDRDLVRMVTSNPAKILGWENKIGSIEEGKKADFIVLRTFQMDPYEKLVRANEKNIILVVINGVPYYGQQRLMKQFAVDQSSLETLSFENISRQLFLNNEQADEVLQSVSLGHATERLREGLSNIRQLAENLESGMGPNILVGADDQPNTDEWILLPDFHEESDDSSFEEWGVQTGIQFSEFAVPLNLDKLTVVEDDFHFQMLAHQPNIPDYIRQNLPPMYSRNPVNLEAMPYVPEQGTMAFAPVPLEILRNTSSNLKKSDKLLIVEQAMLLLEKVYVHLPLKRAMYAVNPLEKLEVVQNDLERDDTDAFDDDNTFHNAILEIFDSLRDLHTNYILPHPYKFRFAYLPFLVEEYFDFQEEEIPKFMVTKIFKSAKEQFPNFVEGVELLSWNNTPIEWIIEQNARQQSGSNDAARRARGIDTLTVRPLAVNRLPYSSVVTISYRNLETNEFFTDTFTWMVSFFPPRYEEDELKNSQLLLANGSDYQTVAVNYVKEIFYGESVSFLLESKRKWFRPTNFPGLMKARLQPIEDEGGYDRWDTFACTVLRPMMRSCSSRIFRNYLSPSTGRIYRA